jgi:hypothetical protein
MLGGDRHHFADRGLQPAGSRAQDRRRAADHVHGIVVAVFMGHQHEIGLDALDGR